MLENAQKLGRTMVVVAAVVLGGSTARAQSRGMSVETRASMSVANPAYALGVAGTYAWRAVELGGFLELNPWQNLEQLRTSMGSTNSGLLANYVFGPDNDLSVRIGVAAGVSVLNEDMIGSRAGSRGVFLNLKLLGVTYALSNKVSLTVDGFDLALSAPQRVGVPIVYAQHRFSAGLRFTN